MRREENLSTATMFSLAVDTNVACLSLLFCFFFFSLAGDNLSRVAKHVVCVSLETNHKVICYIIHQLASPQTSFGVRLSRMRDKRTPQDVCGEAIHQQDTRKSGRRSSPGVLSTQRLLA